MKKTNHQVSEAAMEAAQEMTMLDRKAEKLSALTSGVKVEVKRYNVGNDASNQVSYRLRFTETERWYETNESMTRSEVKRALTMLTILIEQNLFCGVATGGPMRDKGDREPSMVDQAA